jgi:hypothetical protein
MVLDKLHGRHIPNRAVCPFLIVLSPPGLTHNLRFLSREKPVLVQALIPNLAVETFDKCILDRLFRLDDVRLTLC